MLFAAPLMVSAADIAVLRNGFEIRHERRDIVGDKTRLYLNADRRGGYVDVSSAEITGIEHDESVREASTPARQPDGARAQVAGSIRIDQKSAIDINEVVSAAGTIHALDPDFIASVIGAESSFNARAVSKKGAQGLMQLMPETASQLGVKDSFDVRANVDGGTRYLRELLLKYNDDVAKALAAYNAGPHRVDRYGGVPPYTETRQYVARIIRDYNRKKAIKRQTPQSTSSRKTARAKSGAGQAAGGG